MSKQTSVTIGQKTIDENGPGSILRDFQTLLDFVGPDGVRATGKSHLLPLDQLLELDSRMTNPVRPRLQRPQQRSLPHIHGLYLLMRTLQLAVPQGKGKTSGRLVLDPVTMEQWRSLNPTEKYFNLLEAWFLHATSETLGEGASWLDTRMLGVVAQFASELPKSAVLRITNGEPPYPFYGVRSHFQLALGALFGLWEVKPRQPGEGEGWIIETIQRTAWGTSVLDAIAGKVIDLLLPDRTGDEEEEVTEEELNESRRFGRLRRILGESFPDWKRDWEFPQPEFREGVYSFKVSVHDCWRRIAIPSEANLSVVADAILNAFGFDDEHLYEFSLRDTDGRTLRIAHFACDDADEFADETQLGSLSLREQDSMLFHYDFGDDWKFKMLLEEIAPPDKKLKKPKVVERRGTAPKQYPNWD